MSTRAIVEAINTRRDGTNERWALYCHGDGYPEYLGKHLADFVRRAEITDPNRPNRYQRPPDNPEAREKHYKGGFCLPNVSIEACKFIAAFAGYLWEQGYGGAYMTTRDAFEERANDGTDIEYQYRATLGVHGPQLLWYKLSENLDENYKPIGALTPHTLQEIMERSRNVKSENHRNRVPRLPGCAASLS